MGSVIAKFIGYRSQDLLNAVLGPMHIVVWACPFKTGGPAGSGWLTNNILYIAAVLTHAMEGMLFDVRKHHFYMIVSTFP